uniref:Uncharacterized protein n=1 Tax=Caenorhabditis japonica TaxID=281687 RepID=A0A8R1I9B2_CAEJA
MDRNTLRSSREDPRRTSSDIQTVVNSPMEPAPSTRTIVCKPTDYMVGVQFANHSSARRTAKLVSHGLEPIWPGDAQSGPNTFGRREHVKHGGGSCMVWGCLKYQYRYTKKLPCVQAISVILCIT